MGLAALASSSCGTGRGGKGVRLHVCLVRAPACAGPSQALHRFRGADLKMVGAIRSAPLQYELWGWVQCYSA